MGLNSLLIVLAGHGNVGLLAGRLLPPRASLAARSSADERLDVAIMGKRRRRSSDVVFEDGVKVRGESMAAWVYVYRRREGLDEECFFYASFYPILFPRHHSDVLFAKVMVILTRMLKHGGLVLPLSIG